MHKIILIYIFAVLFFIVGCEKQNKTDIIYNFYKDYTSACNNGSTETVLKQYCSKKLLADLDTLYSFDSEDSIIVGIDYDIFFNAQDVLPVENLKVSKIENNLYSVEWEQHTKPIKIKLIKEGGTFKIDELDSYNFEQIKKEVDNYWKHKKSVKI
ncbi:DUF3828 domain-containing protein [Candidatus Ruminimicrobium bovinum]|uniref:DUF3828 domain-containing protein n=1 Tax=Candidatus Ruminimicrobium bovinum TaxID=3242779 RepID=UPI0039B9A97B